MKQLFCILFIAGLAGCTNTVNNKSELQAYLLEEDNGVTKVFREDGFDISLTYYPTDLIVARNDNPSKKQIEHTYKENKAYWHFILDLSYKGHELTSTKLQTEASYTKIIEDFSFHMNNYTEAVTVDLDTINLGTTHFSRTYGMTGKNTIILSFPNAELKKSKRFDIVLHNHDWGFGRQRFRFQTKDIDDVPKIHFK